MKRGIALLLVLAMVLGMAACQSSEKEETTVTSPETDTVEAAAAVKTVNVGDTEMDYIVFGNGEKNCIILPGLSVHSVMGLAESVAAAYTSFASEYTVYLFDRAKEISEGYTVRDMAQDTASAMRTLGLSGADVFGASQGGMIALYLAIDYPDLVNRLVLASTLARPNDTFRAVTEQWISLAEQQDETELLESFTDSVYSEATLTAYRNTLIESNRGITEEEYTRFAILARACLTFDCYNELSKITCPTLVLAAEGDRVTTVNGAQELADGLSCEIFIYDESYGHGVYDEAADFKQRCLAFFSNESEQVPTLIGTVAKHPKFDSAVTNLTEEGFTAAGFAFGDSCDVVFGNGYCLTDVPYFSGYYVATGAPVIVAYPSEANVLVAINNGDLWTSAGLQDGDTVTVTRNTAKKYLNIYEALSQTYSNSRDNFTSDAEFANFRSLSGGNLKENFLFRGASPVDNSRNRAHYADVLLQEHKIQCIINLADNEEDLQSYFTSADYSSDYTRSLYDEGKVVLLSISSNYSAQSYRTAVVDGLRHLLQCGGPAYIHCTEGKDRTGFVCLLIETLMGADYRELRADYMQTYANYYHITLEETPDRYTAIVSLYFDTFLEFLSGESNPEILETMDFTQNAKDYLISGGMTQQELDNLTALLAK